MTGSIARHEDVKYTEHDLIRVINHTYESTVSGRHHFLNHWHEELELTYNFEGKTAFMIDGERIQGEAGRLIAINPKSIHSIIPDMNMSREGVLGVTILLHPKFMEQNFPRYKEFIFTNEKAQIPAEMREILRKISAYTSCEKVGRNVYPLFVKGLNGLVLAAIALHCGAYQIDTSKQDLTTQLMGDFLPEKGSEREIDLIGVVNHVTRNYPPCFVMTCTDDFLKYQAPVMVEKLILENVPFKAYYYGDKNNLLPHVFHLDVRSQDAKVCNDETCEFFRKFL